MRPWRATTSATTVATSSLTVTSRRIGWMRSSNPSTTPGASRSGLRIVAMTVLPRRASSRDASAPKPRDAPVTMHDVSCRPVVVGGRLRVGVQRAPPRPEGTAAAQAVPLLVGPRGADRDVADGLVADRPAHRQRLRAGRRCRRGRRRRWPSPGGWRRGGGTRRGARPAARRTGRRRRRRPRRGCRSASRWRTCPARPCRPGHRAGRPRTAGPHRALRGRTWSPRSGPASAPRCDRTAT